MKCEECDKTFKPKRSHARFCSASCKVKSHNKRKQQKQQFELQQKAHEEKKEVRNSDIDQRINELKADSNKLRAEMLKAILEQKQIPLRIDKLNQLIQQKEAKQHECVSDLDLEPDTLLRKYSRNQTYSEVKEFNWVMNTALNYFTRMYFNEKKGLIVENLKNQIANQIALLEDQKENCKAEIVKLQNRFKDFAPITDKYLELIKVNDQHILKLEELKFAPIKEEPKLALLEPKQNKTINGIGGADLLNMKFNTFRLQGELGRFLGELDRNMTAFALTGDSGAGKSYFSFQLAKLFIDYGFNCKYFSMEEGLGKLTQDKLRAYDLGNELTLAGNGTLRDVRKDAKSFDVIILDSFQKLNVKPDEFEKLRQDFPKTIFIIIFQKTTAGTIRGGSSIKFNSSATIDVQLKDGERIAFMEKGRYGTIGWIYSISEGYVIGKG